MHCLDTLAYYFSPRSQGRNTINISTQVVTTTTDQRGAADDGPDLVFVTSLPTPSQGWRMREFPQKADNGEYTLSNGSQTPGASAVVPLRQARGAIFAQIQKGHVQNRQLLPRDSPSGPGASLPSKRGNPAFKSLDYEAKEYCAHSTSLQEDAKKPPPEDQHGVLISCKPGRVVGNTSIMASDTPTEVPPGLTAPKAKHTPSASARRSSARSSGDIRDSHRGRH